jgi:hypothetical protein
MYLLILLTFQTISSCKNDDDGEKEPIEQKQVYKDIEIYFFGGNGGGFTCGDEYCGFIIITNGDSTPFLGENKLLKSVYDITDSVANDSTNWWSQTYIADLVLRNDTCTCKSANGLPKEGKDFPIMRYRNVEVLSIRLKE